MQTETSRFRADTRISSHPLLSIPLALLLVSTAFAAPGSAFAGGFSPSDGGYYEPSDPSYEEGSQQERVAEEARLREEANAEALSQMKNRIGPGMAAFEEEALQSARETVERANAAEKARLQEDRQAKLQAALDAEAAEKGAAAGLAAAVAAGVCAVAGAAVLGRSRLRMSRRANRQIAEAMGASRMKR